MKRKIIFVWIILLFILSLIAIFDEKNNIEEKVEEKEVKEIEKEIIEKKANQTIKVKMHKENKVIAMDINDYLRGVLASEMPAKYDIEALKAQAIVARTYTYRKMEEGGEVGEADICDNFNHCQAFYPKDKIMEIWKRRGFDDNLRKEYWDKINTAVNETEDIVIMYKGEYIKAFFHASSPIATENVNQIWGKSNYEYLKSVKNNEDESYENRYSKVLVKYDEMEKYIRENINNNYKLKDRNNIYISSYTTSNRVNTLFVDGINISAEKLRVIFKLKSTLFNIEKNNEGIIFNVTGYGHGIGLSQVGSDYLAKHNYKCEDIIKYYYTGVDVVKLNK